MHVVPFDRKIFLGALVALALLAGALFASAPRASAAMSQCSLHTVCMWTGSNFTGEFSQWSESETGCHNHKERLTFKSGWNRGNTNVEFGTHGLVHPAESFSTNGSAFSGEICIK
jgi:hypothetical protein